MDDLAIRVDSLEKTFKLPHERAGSVKHLFINFFRYRRSYEKQKVLEEISFEIKKGEFFGIVGRNGSGKSTLLKLLAGVYSPDSGHIQINGKLVPFIELGVGFNPELTGRENVYLNGGLLGFSDKEIDGFYDEVVKFAELERFMDQKLKNYSSGMQVRLAFSMAVRADADILLIDEVLAVGDADFQKKCFDYFKYLKKAKKTVIFVSHDMEAIKHFCERAILLEKSKLIKIDRAEKIALEYQKLFNKSTNAFKLDSKNRWGNGHATIQDVKVEADKNTIIITETIGAKRAVPGLVLGFSISDKSGRLITGTNTRLESSSIGAIRKNEKVKIRWSIPNILSEGEYYISPTIHDLEISEVLDWWEEAKYFTVKKDRKLPFYSIDPGFNIEILK